MASDDRKRRIKEHLARSSDLIKYTPPTPPPAPVTPPPAPVSKVEFRKRSVMDHLALSSAEFGEFSLSQEPRKKQIKEHLRKSLG
jgi:hypothetical protein